MSIESRLQRLEHVHASDRPRTRRHFLTQDGAWYLETTQAQGVVNYRRGLGPALGSGWTAEQRALLISADELAAIERDGWRVFVVHEHDLAALKAAHLAQ